MERSWLKINKIQRGQDLFKNSSTNKQWLHSGWTNKLCRSAGSSARMSSTPTATCALVQYRATLGSLPTKIVTKNIYNAATHLQYIYLDKTYITLKSIEEMLVSDFDHNWLIHVCFSAITTVPDKWELTGSSQDWILNPPWCQESSLEAWVFTVKFWATSFEFQVSYSDYELYF